MKYPHTIEKIRKHWESMNTLPGSTCTAGEIFFLLGRIKELEGMHTIKVDVENCIECRFRDDPGTHSHSLCVLAWASRGWTIDVPWDQEEAPEWCPAREGVRVEKS